MRLVFATDGKPTAGRAILAVPEYVIARDAYGLLRSKDVVDKVTDRVSPAVQQLLQ